MPLVETPRPSHSSEARYVMSLRIRASTASSAAWLAGASSARAHRTAHVRHQDSLWHPAITVTLLCLATRVIHHLNQHARFGSMVTRSASETLAGAAGYNAAKR